MTPLSSNLNLQLEYRHYRRPFRSPIVTAHGVWSEREGVLVRLEAPDGRTGYGEAAPISWFSPELVSQEADGQSLPEQMGLPELGDVFKPSGIHGVTSPWLHWALECALAQLNDPTLPGVRVPVAGLLPAGEEALTALPAQMASARRAFKWKIGVYPCEEEIDIANRLAKALPKGVRLRLDANAGLTKADYASWLSWCSAHLDIVDYLEQPLGVGQEAEMFEQAAGTGVSIALDESIVGVDVLMAHAERFPQAVLIVKPSLLGSRAAYLRWRSANFRHRVVYSTSFETAVGLKAVWELAALDWPPLSPAGLDAASVLEDDGLCPMRIGWEISHTDWPQSVEEQVWKRLQ